VIDVGIDPKTGERRQEKKGGFKTKKDAQNAAATIMVELEQGIYIKESDATFEEFSQEWLQHYENSGKRKESTIRIRQHEIDKLKPYLAKLKLKNITRKQYQDALNDLKSQGKSEKTIEGVHVTGRMIFKTAIEFEMIKKDPTQFAVIPKTVKTIDQLEAEEEIIKYLEKEELSLFLKTAREKGLDKDYTVFLVLAYTGMRDGELSALKWKDVDLDEGTINITKTYYNPKNNVPEYKLLPPKTKTSKRKITVDDVVLEELNKHKAKQNVIKMENRKTYHDKDFIFTKEEKYLGYPEITKTYVNRMRRLLKLAGLNTALTPHSLRHTHTSLLAEAGVSLPEIMERLGHKDDEITKQVYMHTTKTMKKEASRKFSELMRSL
jgi:integrase